MTNTTRRRHEEMFTRRRTAGKKTNARVRVMIAVFPAAPPSPLVMAALAALTGTVPTVAWGQGSTPTAPAGNAPAHTAPLTASVTASAHASAPAVGAPVPLLPPATRIAPHQTSPSQNADRTPTMMTDTPEYCASLGGRVEDMAREAKASSEAADLMREGQRLCEGGKTRVGVQHLRRAFIMLRQTNTDR